MRERVRERESVREREMDRSAGVVAGAQNQNSESACRWEGCAHARIRLPHPIRKGETERRVGSGDLVAKCCCF